MAIKKYDGLNIVELMEELRQREEVMKLTEKFVGSYTIKETVLANAIKLKLLESIGIHLVINISRVVRYKGLVKGQKVEEPEPIKVDGVKEWKVARIINKRVEQECVDLENAKEAVTEFKGRISMRLEDEKSQKWQRKMTLEEKSYWRKYIAKILYGWDNGKVDGAGNKTGENDIKNAGTDQ